MASDQDSLALIADREGYSPTPYWDVNAYRAGYGSDTYTDANGVVHQVTPSSTVSAADAARDLARRTALVQQGIIDTVGQSAWDGLSDNQKAAVTSLGYNYGGLTGLPSLVSAIQSGDSTSISNAILARAQDNGGVNADRRTIEAQIAAGAPIPKVNIPDVGNSSVPLPVPRPDTSTLFGNTNLPSAAMYGVSPLTPGQPGKAILPTDFTTGDTGSPISDQLQSLLAPQPTMTASGIAQSTAGSTGNASILPQTAPTPYPTPSWLQPTVSQPTQPTQQLLTLPNGKQIAPGTYPASNDGSTYTVSAGPNGQAVVTMNNPGALNLAKMGPDTVAGGYIGNAISSAIPQVQANVGNALSTAGTNLGNAVNTAKGNIGGLLGGLGSLFGGGGAVAPAPTVPSPPTTQYTQQQMQVANPAYEAYIKAQNADDIGAGPGSFADLQSSLLPSQAPPQYITVDKQVPVAPTAPTPLPTPSWLLPQADPDLGMFGTTPIGHLYEALTGQPVTGGLLGLLTNATTPGASASKPAAPAYSIPASLMGQNTTIATGKTVPIGSVSQGGAGPSGQPYSYQVQPDGTIVNNLGQITATANGPVGMAATAAQNYYKSATSGNLNRGHSNSAGNIQF